MKHINKILAVFAVVSGSAAGPVWAVDDRPLPFAPPAPAEKALRSCQNVEVKADLTACLADFDATVYAVSEINQGIFGKYYPNEGMAPESCIRAEDLRAQIAGEYPGYVSSHFTVAEAHERYLAYMYFSAMSACVAYQASQIEAGAKMLKALTDDSPETQAIKNLRAAVDNGRKMAAQIRPDGNN